MNSIIIKTIKNSQLIVLGLLCLSFNLKAQDNLSLKDAIEIGLKSNFQIQIAGKNIEVAERNNNWLEAGALPSISANASQGFNWSDNNNPASFIQGTSQSNSLTYGADLNWVLFNGFKVKISKDRLQYLQEQSEGNAAVVVENTIQSIILGYYNVLLQQEKLNAIHKLLEVSSDRYKYMQDKKDLGSASTFDLLQVKNALLTDSTNYLMQELAFKNAQRNLNMLMAINVENKYVLTDKLEHTKNLLSIDGLKEKMLSNNQTLKNQYINQNILKKDKNLMRANLFPVFSFNTGTNKTISGFKGNSISGESINTSGNESFTYYANLSLTFTLFNGHKTHRAYGNLKIQEEIADLTINEMELSLTNDLISAYELYSARTAILYLTKSTLENAELNLQIATEKYKTGSISSFEFRDIQTSYLNTAATHLESVFNAISGNTDIVRLTGGIIEDFK
ncbi:TolC family protein [Vicingus serpentipes]|uniref:TolC family protein n=1 Tax=Vicingus serpentipes TaxID=1926625 RepID=A0A5C6RUQ4_9FLAO|nr:TolC family protein [Vicingus serpentipes]TXB65754.1 TolC family protein [Vicingus serpentipes]